jgi:acyl carrier protein
MLEKLQNIVEENLGAPKNPITLETHIINDLNADSLDLVELIMAVEEAFDITIDDSEAENLMTVGDIIRFIESK